MERPYYSSRRERERAERPMNVLVKAIALLGLVLLVHAITARADGLHVDLGLAKDQFSNAGDNIWLDRNGYVHHEDLHPWGGILGVSDDVNDWLGWRVWAIDFGNTSSYGVWPSDEDYFAHIHSDPIYQGIGHGHAYGLSAGPTFNYSPGYGLKATAEMGLLLYRATWSESVQKLDSAGNGIGPWTDISSEWTGAYTGWTPYAGFGLHYHGVFVAYRKYRDIHAYNGVFGNATKQYIVGYAVEWR